MLRRIVNWFGYLLHIKERKELNLLQTLTELLPVIYAAMIVMVGVRVFEPSAVSRHKRLKHRLRHWFSITRAVVIGY